MHLEEQAHVRHYLKSTYPAQEPLVNKSPPPPPAQASVKTAGGHIWEGRGIPAGAGAGGQLYVLEGRARAFLQEGRQGGRMYTKGIAAHATGALATYSTDPKNNPKSR